MFRWVARLLLRGVAVISGCMAIPTVAQVYSDLETPAEMPKAWIGYYAKDLTACRSDTYLEGVAIERKGLHFYEAAAFALRIVWVNDGEELYMYGILGGEGTAGPASYRIRRAADGKSIVFFGGKSADNADAAGERLIKCPEGS